VLKVYKNKYRAFLTYFSFSIATSLLGFIASVIMMNLMRPEEFGRVALFLSINFIIAPLISLSAENLLAIKKSSCSDEEYQYFRSVYVTFSYMAFCLVQLILFFAFKVYGKFDYLYLIIPFFALVKFLIALASLEYVMENESVKYGLLSFGTTLFSLILTVLLLTQVSASADCRIVAMLAADFLFLLIRYRGRSNLLLVLVFSKTEITKILRFGFPLLLAVAPAWALNESDKLVVARFVDLASVGVYAAAGTIGGVLVSFNIALLNSITPRLYLDLGDRSKSVIVTLKQNLFNFLKSAVVFSAIYAIVYSVVVDFLFPEKYSEAKSVVYVVILCSLARSSYAVLGAAAEYFGLTVQKLKAICVAGVFAVLSTIIGVNIYGIIGAAFGVGVGYFVLTLMLWFYLATYSRSRV
jgi:O-antigen/teichoic acid export membrane protein